MWDTDTLHCIKTLNGHADAVMSLLHCNGCLFSCSLDCTIKVWFATEGQNWEVIYTHNEENVCSFYIFIHFLFLYLHICNLFMYLLSFCLSIYKITTMKWFLIDEEHAKICQAINSIIIRIRN